MVKHAKMAKKMSVLGFERPQLSVSTKPNKHIGYVWILDLHTRNQVLATAHVAFLKMWKCEIK